MACVLGVHEGGGAVPRVGLLAGLKQGIGDGLCRYEPTHTALILVVVCPVVCGQGGRVDLPIAHKVRHLVVEDHAALARLDAHTGGGAQPRVGLAQVAEKRNLLLRARRRRAEVQKVREDVEGGIVLVALVAFPVAEPSRRVARLPHNVGEGRPHVELRRTVHLHARLDEAGHAPRARRADHLSVEQHHLRLHTQAHRVCEAHPQRVDKGVDELTGGDHSLLGWGVRLLLQLAA